MAHINQMTPVYRKAKPVFLLFEVPADPAGRRNAPIMLGNILSAIRHFSSYGTDFFPRLFLYPYGTGCNGSPQRCKTPEDIRPEALLGRAQIPLSQVLRTLSGELSRDTALNFDGGCLAPVVLLVGSCAKDPDSRIPLNDLHRNPWFAHCLRGIFCSGSAPDPQFVSAFLSCPPREAESRRLLLRPGTTAEEMEFMIRAFFFTGKKVPGETQASPLTDSPEQTDPSRLVVVDPPSGEGLCPEEIPDTIDGYTEYPLMGEATVDPDGPWEEFGW